MIHNGIEYGLMQAYAEGFDILRNAGKEGLPAEQRFDLDLADIAEVWRRGSVVTSWLLDLTAAALAESPALDEYDGPRAGLRRGPLDHPGGASRRRCRPTCSPPRSSPASARGRSHTFAEKVLSAMRMGSAATSSRRRQ